MDVDPPQMFHTSAFEFEVELDPEIKDQTSFKLRLDKGRSNFVINNILLPPAQRVHNTRSTDSLKTDNETVPGELLLTGLSELVRNASDDSTLACINKNYGSVRQGIDVTGAITQCLKVIGGHKKQSCWICGLPIEIGQKLLKPECEHIFPIAQAIGFTGLFSSSLYKRLQDTSQQNPYIEGLKLEYGWAHKICNRKKNDTHFIKLIKDPTTKLASYVIDDTLISKFLNELVTTENFDKEKNPLFGKNLSLRVSEIGKRCNAILKAAITDVDVDVDTHAANTLNDLRTYIINNFDCGISPPVPDTAPTIARSSSLSEVSSEYIIELRDYYFKRMIELYIPGFLNETMTSLPPNIINGINISDRKTGSRIKSIFNKIWNDNRNTIYVEINTYIQRRYPFRNNLYDPNFIKRVRYTILIILIENFPSYLPEQLWSKFQTSLPGFIFIFVLEQTQLSLQEYLNILNKYLVEKQFIIDSTAMTYIFKQTVQKFVDYEARMNQNVMNTINTEFADQLVKYETLTDKQFEEKIQSYQSEISKHKWFTTGGKRRKLKKTRSKRRKTYRKLRLF